MLSIILIVLLAMVIIVISAYLIAISNTNGSIDSAGRVRKYLLYVPETYDPGTPTPLVISIHGFVQWSAHQQKLTGWNTLADKDGFIVVYPQGTGLPLRWSAHPIEENPGTMNQEIRFITDLIDTLSQEYNIDQSRIYANGMSNGGGMSQMLACVSSDRIAAIGGVAGAYLYPWEGCHPPRPIPVIAFHGKDDSIVPYGGGLTDIPFHRYDFLPVEEWAANWARHNGCTDDPETIPAAGEVSGVRYTGCDGGVEVILYTVENGGHTWPGGGKLPKWLVGHTTQDVNATELMWEFFCKYSKNRDTLSPRGP